MSDSTECHIRGVAFKDLPTLQGAPWCGRCEASVRMAQGLRTYFDQGDPPPIDGLVESDIYIRAQCPKCIFASDFTRRLAGKICQAEGKDIEEALSSIDA